MDFGTIEPVIITIYSPITTPQPITITAPVKGAAPQTTIADGAAYTGSISWAGNPTIFAAKTEYKANITLTAKEGYAFAEGASISVAGASSVTGNTIDADGKTLTATVIFPETADAGALGGTVTIDGTPKIGATLTANTANLVYAPEKLGTLSYQWYRGATAIAGATSATYTLQAADLNQTIQVEVQNSNNSGRVTSASTAAVAKKDAASAPAGVTINGEPSSHTIEVTAITNAEYAISTDANAADAALTWQDTPSFEGLNPNTTYYVYARYKEDAVTKPSAKTVSAAITTAKLAGAAGQFTIGTLGLTYNTSDQTTAVENAITYDATKGGAATYTYMYRYASTDAWTKTSEVRQAGMYEIYATTMGGSTYAAITDVKIGSFTVVRKTLTAADFVKGTNPVYTGASVQAPITTALIAGTDYTVSGTASLTDVASADVTVTYTGAGNYTGIVKRTWNLQKAEIDVTGAGTVAVSKMYDGGVTAGALSGTVAFSGNKGTDDVSITAVAGNYADKNAGTAKTVTLTLSLVGTKAGNYVLKSGDETLVLNTAEIRIADYTMASGFQAAQTTVKGNASFTAPTFVGVGGEAVKGTLTYTVDTVAKTPAEIQALLNTKNLNDVVTVAYSFAATDTNYIATPKTGAFTITVKDIEFKVGLEAATIGNALLLKSAPVYGDTWAEIVQIQNTLKAYVGASEVAGSFTLVQSGAPNAGDAVAYSVVFNGSGYTNVTVLSGTIRIAKKEITPPAANTATFTYTGLPQTYLSAQAGYTVVNGVQTNANESGYTVKAVLADPANTMWADTKTSNDKEFLFVIKKAPITVTAKDQTIRVNDTVLSLAAPVQDVHYTVTGLQNADALGGMITMVYQKAGADVTPDAAAVGTYEIAISGATIPNANYTISFVRGTLTIQDKLTQQITGPDTIALTYGDTAKTAACTSNVSGATLTYAVIEGDDLIQVHATTGALTILKVGGGTAKVKVTASETAEYAKAEKVIPVTIQKATITIQAENKSAMVGAPVPVPTYIVKGLVHGDTLTTAPTLTYETQPVMSVPGTIRILVSGAVVSSAENYESIVYVPGTLTISQKTIYTVTFDANGGYVAIPNMQTGADSKLSTLPAASREGYEFAGWYLANGTQVDASYVFTADTMLYAKWTEKQPEFDWELWNVLILALQSRRYTIEASASEGGMITSAGSTTVRYGNAQMYHILPFEGYKIVSVLVDGKEMGPITAYTFSNVKKDHTISVVFEKLPWQNPFDDVDEQDWFYEDVAFVVQAGLMEGTAAALFSPDMPLNRATIITVLWRLSGSPVVDTSMTFEDLPDAWYTMAMKWAIKNGIILGYEDNTCRPLADITYEQVFAILHRYAILRGVESEESDALLTHLTYSEWAKEDVLWAIENDLFAAIPQEIIDLTKTVTRAEITAYIHALCARIENT